jgi:hypothetical protein
MISEMKSHPLYDKYLFYHTSINRKITDGSIAIYKISESSMNEFVYRYENEHKFADRVDSIYKKRNREVKIDSISGIGTN